MTTPTAFRIDQSKIDAPGFPRSAVWWISFVPTTWATVHTAVNGGIVISTAGRVRGANLERFLTEAANGRLAQSYTRIDSLPDPADVPTDPRLTCWASSEDCDGSVCLMQVALRYDGASAPLSTDNAARIHTCSAHRQRLVEEVEAGAAGRVVTQALDAVGLRRAGDPTVLAAPAPEPVEQLEFFVDAPPGWEEMFA